MTFDAIAFTKKLETELAGDFESRLARELENISPERLAELAEIWRATFSRDPDTKLTCGVHVERIDGGGIAWNVAPEERDAEGFMISALITPSTIRWEGN